MTTTIADFQRLRDRVNRFRLAVEVKAHPGYTESHTFSDGSTHMYSIRGLKSPAQLEDELLTLFVWIWSMKDYLKGLYIAQGADPQLIEKISDSEPSLAIAADIANCAKHSYLRKSRSGKFARLTNVGFTVPGSAIGRITVESFAVGLDVSLPDNASLHATVEFDSCDRPLDAFTVAAQAISAWESCLPPNAVRRNPYGVQ